MPLYQYCGPYLCDIGNSFKTYIYVSYSKLENITAKAMNNLNIALIEEKIADLPGGKTQGFPHPQRSLMHSTNNQMHQQPFTVLMVLNFYLNISNLF